MESAFADVRGLVYDGMGDRCWAVRHETNNVKISAREFPILFKINVKRVNETEAEFTAPGLKPLKAGLEIYPSRKISIRWSYPGIEF